MANSGSLYIFILFYSVIQFTLVTEYKKKCPLAHYCNIHSTIHYKIVTITYLALQLQQPTYISSLLVNYIPPRTLRSACQGLLDTPGSRIIIGARRF